MGRGARPEPDALTLTKFCSRACRTHGACWGRRSRHRVDLLCEKQSSLHVDTSGLKMGKKTPLDGAGGQA